MVGAQGLGQPLGGSGRLEGQGQLLARREGGQVGLLEDLVMRPQRVRGEVMQVEHPSDAAMLHGNGVTGLDHPCEFAGGEGMREGQADNLLLDRDGHLGFDRRLPAPMRQGASIQQAVEAIAPKSLQLPPQALVRQSCEVALLPEGPLTL